LKQRPPFVGIAGIIGAGKSTLARKLGEYLGWAVYYEPVATNEYLDDFYKDMKRWGFAMQVYLLNERFSIHQQIQWSGKPAIQDRTIQEDTVFAEILCKGGNIHPRDWQTYLSLFNRMTTSLIQPNVILYLDVTVDTAMSRIQNRDRTVEAGIPREYMVSLREGYENFITEISKTVPVIRLPWDDFKSTEEVADILLPEIDRSAIHVARWG